MKFAIISGIEGHLPALQTVLDEIQREGINLRSVVCLGNVIGRFQWLRETLDIAREFGAVLRGSREFLLRVSHLIRTRDKSLLALQYAYNKTLTTEDWAYLNGLPITISFYSYEFHAFPYVPTAEQRWKTRFFFRGRNELEVFDGEYLSTIYLEGEETVVDVQDKRFILKLAPITETYPRGIGGKINYAIIDNDLLIIRSREYPFDTDSINPGVSPDMGPYEPIPFLDFNIWEVF